MFSKDLAKLASIIINSFIVHKMELLQHIYQVYLILLVYIFFNDTTIFFVKIFNLLCLWILLYIVNLFLLTWGVDSFWRKKSISIVFTSLLWTQKTHITQIRLFWLCSWIIRSGRLCSWPCFFFICI
jgi:hypothetical protein